MARNDDTRNDFAGSVRGELGFALFCAVLIVVGVFLFRDGFGTHRPLIHLLSISAVGVYCLAWRNRWCVGWMRYIGLALPYPPLKWMIIFLVIGVLTGVLRFFVSRQTGGLELYKTEFATHLSGESFAETIVRGIVFFVALYFAVLVPALLFCGVIQHSMAQAGRFVVGLIIQSFAFGLVHCYMTESFNLQYGFDAFLGAIIFGIAYRCLDSLHPPTVFMASNVFIVTALCLFVE